MIASLFIFAKGQIRMVQNYKKGYHTCVFNGSVSLVIRISLQLLNLRFSAILAIGQCYVKVVISQFRFLTEESESRMSIIWWRNNNCVKRPHRFNYRYAEPQFLDRYQFLICLLLHNNYYFDILPVLFNFNNLTLQKFKFVCPNLGG